MSYQVTYSNVKVMLPIVTINIKLLRVTFGSNDQQNNRRRKELIFAGIALYLFSCAIISKISINKCINYRLQERLRKWQVIYVSVCPGSLGLSANALGNFFISLLSQGMGCISFLSYLLVFLFCSLNCFRLLFLADFTKRWRYVDRFYRFIFYVFWFYKFRYGESKLRLWCNRYFCSWPMQFALLKPQPARNARYCSVTQPKFSADFRKWTTIIPHLYEPLFIDFIN